MQWTHVANKSPFLCNSIWLTRSHCVVRWESTWIWIAHRGMDSMRHRRWQPDLRPLSSRPKSRLRKQGAMSISWSINCIVDFTWTQNRRWWGAKRRKKISTPLQPHWLIEISYWKSFWVISFSHVGWGGGMLQLLAPHHTLFCFRV